MFDGSAKLGGASPGVASKAPRLLTITRDFRAPRDRVWRAWTQPDAIVRWYGPRFYPAAEIIADVRVGGTWRARLTSDEPGKTVLWQSGRYLVVEPSERLEFTFAWETPDHEDGPDVQTHVTVRLEDLPNGGTRMHFSHSGFLSADSELSHSAGWNSTFDRLADNVEDEEIGRLLGHRPTL